MVKVATARSEISPSKAGGLRAFKKTECNVSTLSEELKTYVQEVGERNGFRLGEYMSLWATCAIRSKSLAEQAPLISALARTDPRMSIPFAPLKAAITNAFLAFPHCRPSAGRDSAGNDSVSRTSGSLATQLIVMQNHVRKLAVGDASEKNFENMLRELAHYPDLKNELVQLVYEVRKSWGSEKPAPSPSPERTAEHSKTALDLSGSDVSLDEDELPQWGKIIPFQALAKRPASVIVPKASGSSLAAKVPKMKRPAASGEADSAAPAAAAATAAGDEVATKKRQDFPWTLSWTRLL